MSKSSSRPFPALLTAVALFAAPLAIVGFACNRVSKPAEPDPVVETQEEGPAEALSPAPQAVEGAAAGEGRGTLAPVAVVELFTSEGCSSCPPADENLARLVERADKTGVKLYPLSFHVDYWNYLGWSDPFSSEAYSDRQRTYAAVWKSRRVYTPQMVVNGKTEFVGSQESAADRAVKIALATKARAAVGLTAKPTGKNKIRVDYAIESELGELRLNLAAVQREAVKAVPAGENAGRKLEHRNIVRDFRSAQLTKRSGSWEAELPDDVAMRDALVVAYVQNTDWEVVGAAAVSPAP